MKFSLLFLLLLSTTAIRAQPVYSPEVRAEEENNWMRDSLHLRAGKLKRAANISLNYYRQLDRFAGNYTLQEKVMEKKDANMKPILSRQQYRIYYRREEELRHILRIKYEGTHMPE